MTGAALLDVELDVSDDMASLRADGEIDLNTAHRLDELAMVVWAAPKTPEGLVLDLRDVTFCDVAGLKALARIRRAASVSGVRCHVLPSRPVERVVQAADVEHLLSDGGG